VSREGSAIRVYGALVRLYPRGFREEYGADMVLLMRHQCREQSAWRVLARSAIDLAISIPTQHLEARMRRAPNPVVPLVYMTAAAAGLLVAILGGSEPATLVLGLGLAVVAGAIGTAAWRRSAPVHEPTPVTATWWKFLLAGPLLAAIVIVAAGVGVEAWYLGMVVVLAAFISTAAGFVLGLVHLFSRRVRENAT
jgi:hypothetical protein